MWNCILSCLGTQKQEKWAVNGVELPGGMSFIPPRPSHLPFQCHPWFSWTPPLLSSFRSSPKSYESWRCWELRCKYVQQVNILFLTAVVACIVAIQPKKCAEQLCGWAVVMIVEFHFLLPCKCVPPPPLFSGWNGFSFQGNGWFGQVILGNYNSHNAVQIHACVK